MIISDRFTTVLESFPRLQPVLEKLVANKVYFLIGGSTALYLQGSPRAPHDVDLMFNEQSHTQANEIFNISIEHIERPNVMMYKSSPVNDGSIDFLSRYTVIDDGRNFHSNPVDSYTLNYHKQTFFFVPAEKIVIFKLIGRRLHHSDLEDVRQVLEHCDLDRELFWKFVEEQKAIELVSCLVQKYKLKLKS